MAEQQIGRSGVAGVSSATGMKPVPMKLFSTWEVDKSTPCCIPRLCSLTLTRLVLLKPVENDPQSLIISIKMQSSSKRILRSNEIMVQQNGLLDTELDLSFSLLYPHFLKGDGNRLEIMLQRRKKYKNRTILGYKTLAAGRINMAQVLQQTTDQEMYLFSDVKEQSNPVAQVMILSLSSQPVDPDERRPPTSGDIDRSPGELSEDEETREYPDYSSNEEVSDVEPLPGDDDRPTRSRKLRPTRPTIASRQRNLKQKFVALLRRFKVSDEVLESVEELNDRDANTRYVEELFDDVEALSDSDIDLDTISVRSTPKPKLRPFFAGRGGGSGSHLDTPKSYRNNHESERINEGNISPKTDSDSNNESCDTMQPLSSLKIGKLSQVDSDMSSDIGDQHRKYSLEFPMISDQSVAAAPRRASAAPAVEIPPQRVLTEQMAAILSANNALPDCIVLVDTRELQSQMVAQALQNANYRTVCTCSVADVRAVISAIVNKIQKYCSKNTTAMLPMKIALVGGDDYVSAVVKPYVELFSTKSPDWLTYIRFLVVPFGGGTVSKQLFRMDSKYGSLFNDSMWKDSVCEKLDSSIRFDVAEITSRIVRYLSGATQVVQLPLAEAILTNKDKGTDDSSQIIVPFVGEVRLGPVDLLTSSTMPSLSDPEEIPVSLSSSPPPTSHMPTNDKIKEGNSIFLPSSSTNCGPGNPQLTNTLSSPATGAVLPSDTSLPPDTVDLQVDYWMIPPRSEPSERGDRSSRKEVKCSLKTMFRSMRVCRMLPLSVAAAQSMSALGDTLAAPALSMIVVTREKKQKIMRLKKSKDQDTKKSQQIDNISRLICTSKSQSHPLSVTIDGVDWTGVKFFQLSAQWQTNVKYFPVLVFGGAVPAMSDVINTSAAM